MTVLLALCVAAFASGATLILGSLGWFQRPTVVDRLAPYHPGTTTARRSGVLSVESFRDVVGPLTRSLGGRLGRFFGVRDALEVRLARVHADHDASTFRLRQFGWMGVTLVLAALLSALITLPPAVAILTCAGAPLLCFLVIEHRLSRQIEARQQRVVDEMPIIAEQLGMLLSAGYSLGAALGRIAARGSGTISDDIRRVRRRMHQGLSDAQALREWADTVDVGSVSRLVSVLALNQEATDLGHLISTEARTIRAQRHRELVASIERRTQQVWIPVTVATLVPGVIFMAIPFVEALSLFSTT